MSVVIGHIHELLKNAIDSVTGKIQADVGVSGVCASPEIASAQETEVITTVETYARAVGANQIEIYCESGYIRVRTDGVACTSTTGEPLAAGFGGAWCVPSVSVYYVQESVITVVSR